MKKRLLFSVVLSMSFMVSGQPLTGVKLIPGNYATIQEAIADLNARGVGSDGVIFNVAANHTETLATAASGLITASGTASDSIVFRKDPNTAGNNPKITAFTPGTSTTVDGMIIIAGGDYITIDGIDLQENLLNTNITKMMEWGYALVKKQNTAPINGCQNVVIRNCVITLNKVNYRSAGIYSGNHIAANVTSLTLTAATDAMNNARIYGNTISNVYQGIYLSGYSHPYPGPYTLYDHNNRIGVDGANTITNYGGYSSYPYGIYASCQEYLQVGNNVISGGAGSMYCIFAKTTIASVHDNLIYSNSIPASSGTGGYPSVIYGYYNYESPTEENYYGNIIHDLSVGGTATAINSGVFGIYTKSAGAFDGDARFPEIGFAENPSCPAMAPDVGADEFGGIQANLLTWTGAVSDDWSDPANWSPAMTPGQSNSVVIANGAGREPYVMTAGQSCKDLIIRGGAKVTVATGIQLTVNGHTMIKYEWHRYNHAKQY
jgi:hypothetical protein